MRRGYISRVSQADDVGDPARMTFIVNPIGATFNTAALDVNSAGVVVGFGEDAQRLRRAFRRDPISGVITTLPIFGGASEALDISDAGYVVGFGATTPGSTMGFIIAPGSDVAALTGTLGGASSAAYGVNNLGHAVGESWTAAGDVRAFVVDDRGIVDLNTDFLGRLLDCPLQRTAAQNGNLHALAGIKRPQVGIHQVTVEVRPHGSNK